MVSSYKIDFNDGTGNPGNNPVEVDREKVDTSSVDVTLFGRGTFNYGESLNENILHLLEHFASEEAERDATATTPAEQRDVVAGVSPAASAWAIRQPVVGQMWANKTEQHLYTMIAGNRWDSLANSGDVTVNWGTITHNQTIPLPISATGYVYKQAECAWIAAPAGYGDHTAYLGVSYTNRLVSARASVNADSTGFVPVVCNYMIIGIRDNVNAASEAGTTAGTGNTLTIESTPLVVSGLINQSIAGTLSLTTIDGSGDIVDPAGLTVVWYRLDEGGDAACTTVQYDTPIRIAPEAAVFTFTATSAYELVCNPSWRAVVTHEDGRKGETILQMVFAFVAPQNELVVSTNSISYGSSPTNEVAQAVVNATITGGTAPYTVEWTETAIDGSGAVKTSQNPSVTPPVSPAGTALLTDATYSLQRSTAQTVFTRVSVTVTDTLGAQARGFTTIRYNFIEGSDDTVTPETTPLRMIIDGTLEGVYTTESSAYILATAGEDSRVFTLTIPVQIDGTAQGTQLSITRLRDTDQVQFNLISQAIIPNTTQGEFVFSISASTASNYPGTNSDAWRITFIAQDGRTISRDVITKFNYLTAQRPLTLTVSSNTVQATASKEAVPAPSYVTLTANPRGGVGPFTYLWNVSNITASAPFTVVGPLDRPTLTLALRGTTFDNPQFDNVVWPAPIPGQTSFAYTVPVVLTVRDASQPSQQQTVTAIAGIKFAVDTSDMAIAPLYNQMVVDYTYTASQPYTMKGAWVCNSQFVTPGTPVTYETFQRVSLEVIRGSGAFTYTWVEESRAPGSTLTPVIVFPDPTSPNKSVFFKTAQTNCIAGTRYYEGVWRCNVVDQHTGATLVHRDVIRITTCRGAVGTIDKTIQRVPLGAGFVCG